MVVALESQHVATSFTPIWKKKYTRKAAPAAKDEDEPGSSQEHKEETKIITRS